MTIDDEFEDDCKSPTDLESVNLVKDVSSGDGGCVHPALMYVGVQEGVGKIPNFKMYKCLICRSDGAMHGNYKQVENSVYYVRVDDK